MSSSPMDPLIKPLKDLLSNLAEETMTVVSDAVIKGTDRIIYKIGKKVSATLYSAIFFSAGVLILLIGAGLLIDYLTKINGSGFTIAGICLLIIGAHYNSVAKA